MTKLFVVLVVAIAMMLALASAENTVNKNIKTDPARVATALNTEGARIGHIDPTFSAAASKVFAAARAARAAAATFGSNLKVRVDAKTLGQAYDAEKAARAPAAENAKQRAKQRAQAAAAAASQTA